MKRTTTAGFYQVLKLLAHSDGAERLVRLGEQAHAWRRFDLLEQISQALQHAPVQQAREIGTYFESLCVFHTKKDIPKFERLQEQVFRSGLTRFQHRALLGLGSVAWFAQDFDQAALYYNDAKAAAGGRDPFVTLTAERMLAAIDGLSGDHESGCSPRANDSTGAGCGSI